MEMRLQQDWNEIATGSSKIATGLKRDCKMIKTRLQKDGNEIATRLTRDWNRIGTRLQQYRTRLQQD